MVLQVGLLNLVSPDSYETLYILATSANGSSDIGMRIHFADGTYADFYENIPYWYGSAGTVSYNNLGRHNISANVIEGTAGSAPYLFDITINLSAFSERDIVSMDIYNYRPTQAAIFAISGYKHDVVDANTNTDRDVTIVFSNPKTGEISWYEKLFMLLRLNSKMIYNYTQSYTSFAG